MKRLLVALVALAACAWPQATPASGDPCSVASSAEVGRALGSPVVSTATRSTGDAMSCSYRTAALGRRFVVTVVPAKSVAEAASTFRQMIGSSLTYAAPSEKLAGIGDEAHRLGPMMYVRKGAAIYVFSTLARDGNGAGALRTIAVARAAIARVK